MARCPHRRDRLGGTTPEEEESASFRIVVLVCLFLCAPSASLPLALANLRAADCDSVGDVEFVCGQSGPEDLAAIPESPWVIASSRQANNGGLRLIDTRDLTTTMLLRSETPREQLDNATYDSCPGPIVSVEKEQFSSHGLYMQAGENSQHSLYVVHHGTRESIEVFDVDARVTPPQLTWVGCAVAPDNLSLNSVVAIPGGGFAATSFRMLDGSMDDVRAGKISGAVWEWQTGAGWHEVPGTEASGPNGLEISADGAWLYVGSWGSSAFIRVSRGQNPVQRDAVAVGFRIDNLRRGPGDSILATGHAGTDDAPTTNVATVDARTLQFEEIVRYRDDEVFGRGTTALHVGSQLWVGSFQGDRIARFPLEDTVSSIPSHRALLDQYCLSCHSDTQRERGRVPLSLQAVDLENVGTHADVWEKVVRKLRAGLMPPAGRPRPHPATSAALVSWLEAGLDRAAAAQPNPGRTETFHRLNRAEYQNAIRDLLALDIDVSSLLPADDASYGFDNIAGVLRLNQSLMERYLSAASKISRAAVGRPLTAPTAREFRLSEEMPQYERAEGLPFGTRGGTLIRYNFPQNGEYVINVDLLCRIAGECDGSAGFPDQHELEVTVDGERVQLFVLEPHEGIDVAPPDLEVSVDVEAGPRDVGVAFLKLPSAEEVESLRQRFFRPYYLNGNSMQQRWAIYQPFVDRVTITGPFDARPSGATPSRRRIFECRPRDISDETGCARTILASLAHRGYRRPVDDDDVERLMSFYTAGRREGSFDAGIEMALSRLLTSPEFLFRIETDPPDVAANTNYRVSDLELASRLSFFLWSSIPDDELLDTAARGELTDPSVLRQQVSRMLADARSRALMHNFAGQWLQLRNLDAVHPAVPLFPNFDDGLRQAFRRETELFVDSVLREDRSALELLTADYTFVNERLALHYDLPSVRGSHFRRVALDETARRGLLGHGSILTVTSRPNRTSPVLRGKWILENILGTPPPAPPPNVPPLPGDEGGAAKAHTMRERMGAHRANPACASCHAMIDPPGFALENFDALGRWRNVDASFNPIDASGRLPNGTTFANLGEFRTLLLSRPEQFVTTITEKLLTYALGRGLEPHDMPGVRSITREAASGNFKLSALVEGIVSHQAFLMRRTASELEGAQ